MPTNNGCGLCKVCVSHLSVVRGNETILNDISFNINCGELTAIIGINGAGKTTLLRAMLGEIKHEGNVSFEGHDGLVLSKITIGYVPQQFSFDKSSPVRVSDFLTASRTNRPVSFFGSNSSKYNVHESLKQAGSAELAGKMLGDLSGGELQRVMLAQALYPVPELLILDEPLSGVDHAGCEQFYDSIENLRKNYHMPVIMVSHDLQLVNQYADKTLLINRDLLFQGKTSHVFASRQFEQTFKSGGFKL
ncbi:MAG: metal ABC transporter ATP-binding protein [Oscillospiraceae bacterium]|jgi:zinc transport system ATP-binding protein|nr:metal ABC transporter ATP-binding protein [Oscillospiraceae bacterium]